MADILQQPEYQHIVVISDEVYEHIVFDPNTRPHVSMATIPGMFHRTLTLSSSGKTYVYNLSLVCIVVVVVVVCVLVVASSSI